MINKQKAWESTRDPTAKGDWMYPTKLHKKLTRSLYVYVTPEDAVLNRVQFLKTVMSRIEDDLHYNTT